MSEYSWFIEQIRMFLIGHKSEVKEQEAKELIEKCSKPESAGVFTR